MGVIDAMAPLHGGDITAATQRYGFPSNAWLDLSTGINPRSYPLPILVPALFQHLPRNTNALSAAIKKYCNTACDPVIAAGSQQLIQWLPQVRMQLAQRSRVAVPCIGYAEHAFRWRWAGHDVVTYDPLQIDAIDRLLRDHCPDILVVINPHNPLGTHIAPEQLLAWREQLAARNGWLVVDEAFIDATPQFSIAAQAQQPGLIVLRSLGKFFGLAGVRVGFALCADTLRAQLRTAIGPWAISGPAAAIATTALGDTHWQQSMRTELSAMSEKNFELLGRAPWKNSARVYREQLFTSFLVTRATAKKIIDHFAAAAILARCIDINAEQSIVRFGLVDPECVEDWARLSERCTG